MSSARAIASTGGATDRGARSVLASLSYLGEMSEKPSFHVHEHGGDNLNLVSHVVRIVNARSRLTSLDEEGFCLMRHRSSVANLESRKAVLCVYGREMERLVCELTGAAKVTAAPLGVMRVGESASPPAAVHRPVRFVHADHSDESATKILHRRFATSTGQKLPEGRYAIYHTWRALTPAPQDAPLALCDARSVAAQDGIAADSILDFPGSRADRTEVTLFRYNAAHRWHYFPDMTREEVLVFKDFDSDSTRCQRVPHSAFSDPTCLAGVPPRVSLDLQLFAVF